MFLNVKTGVVGVATQLKSVGLNILFQEESVCFPVLFPTII